MEERRFIPTAFSRLLQRLSLCSLMLPFAVLGLLGALLLLLTMNPSISEHFGVPLLASTPLVAAGLGRYLSPRLRALPLSVGTRLVGASFAAGMINGAIVGLFGGGPMGLFMGLIGGAICAVPFMPALSAVVFVARRIGRARPGSIVDRADRRAVCCATIAVASLALLIASPSGFTASRVVVALLLAASASALILLVVDVGALVLASAAYRQSVAVTLLDAPLAAIPEERAPGAALVDFGIGDGEVEEAVHEGAAYRQKKRTLRLFRGSAAVAQDALAWRIAADATALILGCLCTLWSLGPLIQVVK